MLQFPLYVVVEMSIEYQTSHKNNNPRLTKGGGRLLQPPFRFFSGRSKTLKKVTKGI